MTERELLDLETELLEQAGYFDANGNPIGGFEGKRIWNEVQAKLSAMAANAQRGSNGRDHSITS